MTFLRDVRTRIPFRPVAIIALVVSIVVYFLFVANHYSMKRNEKPKDLKYYSKQVYVSKRIAEKFWMSDKLPYKKINMMEFKNEFERFETVELPFEFPFYGYPTKEVTVMPDGFISMVSPFELYGDSTSYIAPLMARFQLNSSIMYLVSDTVFSVQWENMVLLDSEVRGKFSFQANLFSDGAIVFIYKEVPDLSAGLQNLWRSVKVGVSDSFATDNPSDARRVVYDEFKIFPDFNNLTVVNLGPLPSCKFKPSCEFCTLFGSMSFTSFECTWCPRLQRCSDGLDRERAEWLSAGCEVKDDVCDAYDQCSTCRLIGEPTVGK